MQESDLISFWKEEIKPRFTNQALEARVQLLDGSLERHVNLDNAATTKPFKAVKKRIDKELDEYASVHRGAGPQSKRTTRKYENARETIRNFVGADKEKYVVFTKNTTEAINQAAALFGKGKFVLVSDIEHSSNLLPWEEKSRMFQYLTDAKGEVHQSQIKWAIIEGGKELLTECGLIALTGASNITGYKPPVYQTAELAHTINAKILVDVCQLIPHEKVNVLSSDDSRHLDFITFSGHKMYAPLGIGVLVGPKKFFDRSYPYQIGGGNLSYITPDLLAVRSYRERDHDPGTPNVIGVFALEEAIKQLEDIGVESISQYEHGIVQLAFERLREISNLTVYLDAIYGTVIPFDIDGLPPKLGAEVLAQEYGISTRAGSSCAYRLVEKLKGIGLEQAIGIGKEAGLGTYANIPGVIRASFAVYNKINDVDRFIGAVKKITGKGPKYYLDRYQMDPSTGEWNPK